MSTLIGPLFALRRGVVASFDEPSGLGEVQEKDGTLLRFHCSAIADGTRTIAAGEPVFYVLRTTLSGEIEATDLAVAAMLDAPERFRDEPAGT